MAVPDSAFALWLKEGALYVSSPSSHAATWPIPKGIETEIVSPYATKAAATAEGAKQVDFLKGPLVRDNVQVAGARKDLLGKAITLSRGNRLGYVVAGVPAFVLGVQEQSNGTTTLNVVKSLT